MAATPPSSSLWLGSLLGGLKSQRVSPSLSFTFLFFSSFRSRSLRTRACKSNCVYSQSLTHHGSTYDSSTWWWWESNMCWKLYFECWILILLGLKIQGLILSHEAGQQQLQLPLSHAIKRANNWHDSCVQRQPCCFPLSSQHPINYMRYSTLYYKRVRCICPPMAN